MAYQTKQYLTRMLSARRDIIQAPKIHPLSSSERLEDAEDLALAEELMLVNCFDYMLVKTLVLHYLDGKRAFRYKF